MTVAFTHPGKLGDVLAVLPAVAANAPELVDFWTSPYCAVLGRFLERQRFIRRVLVSRAYRLRDFRHGARPRAVPVSESYRRVVHLGFPSFPRGYVPAWIARETGLRPPRADLPLQFAPCDTPAPLSDPCVPLQGRAGAALRCPPRPYVACHFKRPCRVGQVGDTMDFLEARLAETAARFALGLWHPPRRAWSAAQFDWIAGAVARAAVFVGEFSCLSQVAALAGVPMVVLVEPARRRAVPWFRPPDRRRAWYLDWQPASPLPDLDGYFERALA